MTAADRGWSHVLGSYRGGQRRGGQVRRGEHGTPVVSWKPTERPDRADDSDTGAGSTRRSGLLARAFMVFAARSVEAERPAWTAPGAEVSRRGFIQLRFGHSSWKRGRRPPVPVSRSAISHWARRDLRA